jgi:16S rRNA (cytosine967-C5)-methyltransferase
MEDDPQHRTSMPPASASDADVAAAREVVDDFLVRLAQGERADRVLAGELRRRPSLSSLQRRLAAEWALGIALWCGRLDTMAEGDSGLRLPLFLIDREQRDPAEVARWTNISLERLRRALLIGETHAPADGAEALAFRRSLPVWLARRWIDQLGSDRADGLAAAMNEPGPVTVRANTLRCDRDALAARLLEEGVRSRACTLAPHGLVLEGRPNILGLTAWRDGLFEVQDEGSQLVAEATRAAGCDLVVDLCAGSGGKTLALGAAMQNRGRLVAIDVNPARLADLRARSLRHGLTCVAPRCADATRLDSLDDLRARADVVLIDAPCSSVGTLRRGPDARWRLKPDDFARWSTVQRALLASGATLVKPGGRLLYATCSLDPLENEDVVTGVTLSGFSWQENRRVWPDTDGTDGFFWAVWTRHSQT